MSKYTVKLQQKHGISRLYRLFIQLGVGRMLFLFLKRLEIRLLVNLSFDLNITVADPNLEKKTRSNTDRIRPTKKLITYKLQFSLSTIGQNYWNSRNIALNVTWIKPIDIVDPDSTFKNIRISSRKKIYLTETQDIYRMSKKSCPISILNRLRINNASWTYSIINQCCISTCSLSTRDELKIH